jgi:hypothetical protein
MEELRHLTGIRIGRRGTRSFPQRARDARECQVLERSGTASYSRNDVVDVERRFLAGLCDSTILAPLARSEPDSAL